MADKEEEALSSGGDNTTPRGTVDWEVVSLTASAYAASPGPKPVDDDNKDVSEAETSHPLYISGHFVFPPPSSSEEHHNTNMEPSEEIYQDNKASKKMVDSDYFSMEQQEETPTVGGGDLSSLKGDDDELSGLDFFQEEEAKGKSNICKQDERAFGGSHVYQQTEPIVRQQTDITPDDDDQLAAAPPPCEPWWKRSAASLLSQAKETNTVWSIFIAAAAVMGVVVLGQRWQHERWQLLQLNWESTIAANNEKAGRLMGPISRLKHAFVGGQRRDSFIRASSQNDS